jgi:hypothetical protein
LFGGNDNDSSNLKRDPLLVRLAKLPAELVKPFKVLLPKVPEGASTHRKKDYRLMLLAMSYTLAMVVPVRLSPPHLSLYVRVED